MNKTHHPPYNKQIIEQTLYFLNEYTQLAQQLCEALARLYQVELPPTVAGQASVEPLFDHIYEQDDDIEQQFTYAAEQWQIHLHGEHCLFISDRNVRVEVNTYDRTWIDAGFFLQFITHHPEAAPLVHAIQPADFQQMINLLEYITSQRRLLQVDLVNFKLA
ncbi:hypothetical protein [Paenibacillus campi]|uniref:hypothetical protein n=1 Tax=Paenibacillus campi TaxID=3106031 RepID=UPI002AFDDB22|nr:MULTISPECIES: hypothetical protein [unclassified Paenibacillus]